MPPRRLMMATAMNEQIEVQLTCHAAATRRRFRAFIMVLLRRWQLRRGLEYTAFPDDGSATQPWQEMAPLRRRQPAGPCVGRSATGRNARSHAFSPQRNLVFGIAGQSAAISSASQRKSRILTQIHTDEPQTTADIGSRALPMHRSGRLDARRQTIRNQNHLCISVPIREFLCPKHAYAKSCRNCKPDGEDCETTGIAPDTHAGRT
jgi:hypothetical protein